MGRRTLIDASLLWKLHRVTPLCHVLDFLTLINLMDQFGRMIDEPHGRFTRHTGATQAIDVGDTQAVKTQMWLVDFDEQLLPPARRLEWKFHREFTWICRLRLFVYAWFTQCCQYSFDFSTKRITAPMQTCFHIKAVCQTGCAHAFAQRCGAPWRECVVVCPADAGCK